MIRKKSTSPSSRHGRKPRRINIIPVPSDPPFESLLQVNAAIAAQVGLVDSVRAEIAAAEARGSDALNAIDQEMEDEARDQLVVMVPGYPLKELGNTRWGDYVTLIFTSVPWKVKLILWEDRDRNSPRFSLCFESWRDLEIDAVDTFHVFACAVRKNLEGMRLVGERIRKALQKYNAAKARHHTIRQRLLEKENAAFRQLAALETVKLLHGLRLVPGPRMDTFTFRLEARRTEEFEWLRVTGVNEDRTIAEVTGCYRESLSKGPGHGRIPTGKKFTITRYARVATMGTAFCHLITNGRASYRFRGLAN
ncbi:MAG: hypothetical protein ACKORJ_10120 [Bacteroidota bacterium]